MEVEKEGTAIESSHLTTPHGIIPYHTIPYSTSHTHTLSLSQYPRPTGWLAGWLQESSLLMTAVIILIYNNYEDDWYVNKRRKEEKNKRSVTLTANMIWSDLMTEREREGNCSDVSVSEYLERIRQCQPNEEFFTSPPLHSAHCYDCSGLRTDILWAASHQSRHDIWMAWGGVEGGKVMEHARQINKKTDTSNSG